MLRVALAIAAASVLLAGCLWEVPGADPNRTSNAPFDHAITVGNVSTLQEAFQAAVPGPVTAPV